MEKSLTKTGIYEKYSPEINRYEGGRGEIGEYGDDSLAFRPYVIYFEE
jgi:hypothetical protein